MIENRYRLKDYIITEYDDLFCSWEMNIVLGEHRVGNCFIVGDILIIQSSGHQKNGCLKLEYGEKLNRLPTWTKTKYYCFSDSLKDVNTRKSLSNNLDQSRVEKEKYLVNINIPDKKCEYQLGQLKIIVNSDGTLSWEKLDGLNKKSSGSCVVISGILFLESKPESYRRHETKSRREWARELKLLPKWNVTFAWGDLKILKICGRRTEIKKIRSVIPHLDFIQNRIRHPINNPNHNKQKTKKDLNSLSSIPEKFTSLFNYFQIVKDWWLRVNPRVIEALWTGYQFFSLLMKKVIFGIQKANKYFRAHFRK
jgi:hypothetical protein